MEDPNTRACVVDMALFDRVVPVRPQPDLPASFCDVNYYRGKRPKKQRSTRPSGLRLRQCDEVECPGHREVGCDDLETSPLVRRVAHLASKKQPKSLTLSQFDKAECPGHRRPGQKDLDKDIK